MGTVHKIAVQHITAASGKKQLGRDMKESYMIASSSRQRQVSNAIPGKADPILGAFKFDEMSMDMHGNRKVIDSVKYMQ